MKLGIMQPYFFPYLGYFDLIHHADRFILFDTAQYIRHGWVNRNRILHPRESWKYIVVPLQKHARETPINEIRVVADSAWKKTLLGQLDHYRGKAPYYRETKGLVESVLSTDELSLARLNGSGLTIICHYLGIAFQEEYFSEMDVILGEVQGPGDWALEISRSLGATSYVNPIGGAEIFELARFEEVGIELELRSFSNLVYACRGYQFEPALSILDVLMWNAPPEIRAYLQLRDGAAVTSQCRSD